MYAILSSVPMEQPTYSLPKKEQTRDMVKELDVAMQHLSDVIFHTTGKDVSLHPGAGAAGGMGGSLHAFLDAQLQPGIELLLETLDFAEKIKDADLLITGEREIGPADSYGESTFGHLAGSKEATYSRHPAGRSDRGCRDTECSRIPGRILHYPLSRLFGAGHAA